MISPVTGVDHLGGAAGEIDEQLLAGDMDLAHRRLQPAGPGPVEIAEPGIAEPVGARRRGTPPTAAPASRRDGAARDAPRPNRASGADRRGCRRAAETAALRAARRRDPRAAARRCRRRAPGSDSRLTAPWLSPRLRAIARCGSLLAKHSRKTSRIWRIDSLSAGISSPLSTKRTRLPSVENRQRRGALHHRAGLITITGLGDHVRPESVITFHRIE